MSTIGTVMCSSPSVRNRLMPPSPAIAFAIMFSFACAAETAPAQQTLRHYEFRADQLPPPFATPSAGNPPRVTSRPAGAQLTLPPGFKISVFADNLDDPRRMLQAAN